MVVWISGINTVSGSEQTDWRTDWQGNSLSCAPGAKWKKRRMGISHYCRYGVFSKQHSAFCPHSVLTVTVSTDCPLTVTVSTDCPLTVTVSTDCPLTVTVSTDWPLTVTVDTDSPLTALHSHTAARLYQTVATSSNLDLAFTSVRSTLRYPPDRDSRNPESDWIPRKMRISKREVQFLSRQVVSLVIPLVSRQYASLVTTLIQLYDWQCSDVTYRLQATSL